MGAREQWLELEQPTPPEASLVDPNLALTHDSGNRRKHESRNPIQRALIARFHRAVVEAVHRVAPATILDVGCGEGYVLSALREHGCTAALHGIDMNPGAIAYARTRLSEGANLQLGDARRLVEEKRNFDLVMMLEVLEHLDEPASVMPMLQRLGRKAVLLSVPNEPYFRGLNFLRGKNLKSWGNDPEHVQNWTRRGFLRFVRQHFDIVWAPGVFPWTMVLATVKVRPVENPPEIPPAANS
jgi:SAM-dependent methyltransferase